MKFKEGDRVRLKKDSRFYEVDQRKFSINLTTVGHVDDTHTEKAHGWFVVKWDNETSAGYQEQDVELMPLDNKLNRKLYPSYVPENGYLVPTSVDGPVEVNGE